MAVRFKIRLKNFWQVLIKESRRLVLRRLAVLYTTVCRIFIGRELPHSVVSNSWRHKFTPVAKETGFFERFFEF